ncbi:hypothetical protein NKDENANG_00910 [Candidatus Entotheonellaceae bacterium PAL068K]
MPAHLFLGYLRGSVSGRMRKETVDIDLPASWAWSAGEILRHKWRKVLVMGAVDRGKSTYCGFLSSQLLAAGMRVALVDADVGQKDIGPPATITLGYPEPALPLAQVQPMGFYFVGAVNPVGHLLPMVVGTRQLVDAARAAVILINTTGFVHGVGQVLKSFKIEAVRPDVVVAIVQGAELQAITRAYRHHRVLRISPSDQALAKTPEQRREARQKAFYRYFQAAAEVVMPRRQLIVHRTSAAAGLEQHLLCGIADRRNKGRGLALITKIDTTQHTIAFLTPVPAPHIRIVQRGGLYLSPDGRELGRR